MVPFSNAGYMSPPAICCGTVPSLARVLPAHPPIRILMPFKSSTVWISLRNQPPICVPVLPPEMAYNLYFLPKSLSMSWPP